jgi:micrococcal nuclease
MYIYNVQVHRVVDGDTVDVEIDLGFEIHYKARVRLEGIDTPETRTKDKEEKVAGLAAKRRLTSLVLDAKDVTIQTQYDKRGKFGRVLGTLFLGDVNINQKLLDEGHAKVYGEKG